MLNLWATTSQPLTHRVTLCRDDAFAPSDMPRRVRFLPHRTADADDLVALFFQEEAEIEGRLQEIGGKAGGGGSSKKHGAEKDGSGDVTPQDSPRGGGAGEGRVTRKLTRRMMSDVAFLRGYLRGGFGWWKGLDGRFQMVGRMLWGCPSKVKILEWRV